MSNDHMWPYVTISPTPPLNFMADGGGERGTFFCDAHISVWQRSERGLHHRHCHFRALSFPPHWPIYSGLSALDKDGAFRQFSRQETQALRVTPNYSQTHQSPQSAAGKTMDDTVSLDFWQRNWVTLVWTHRRCWNRHEVSFSSGFVSFGLTGQLSCPWMCDSFQGLSQFEQT